MVDPALNLYLPSMYITCRVHRINRDLSCWATSQIICHTSHQNLILSTTYLCLKLILLTSYLLHRLAFTLGLISLNSLVFYQKLPNLINLLHVEPRFINHYNFYQNLSTLSTDSTLSKATKFQKFALM